MNLGRPKPTEVTENLPSLVYLNMTFGALTGVSVLSNFSISLILANEKRSLEDFYSVGSVLGNGGFGVVYSGTRKIDGKSVSL